MVRVSRFRTTQSSFPMLFAVNVQCNNFVSNAGRRYITVCSSGQVRLKTTAGFSHHIEDIIMTRGYVIKEAVDKQVAM